MGQRRQRQRSEKRIDLSDMDPLVLKPMAHAAYPDEFHDRIDFSILWIRSFKDLIIHV